MTLRAQLAIDATTFLDQDEFGDAVIIDGLSGLGSWEPVEQEQGDPGGYYADQRRYFVMVTGLALPVLNQQLDIDGSLWTVDKAHADHGIMEIDVTRNLS